MRKLKLQMQISVDGYVAGPEGQLDWMIGCWDDELLKFGNELTDSIDTILLGRKMTKDFVNYWEDIAANQPDSPEFDFAHKMVAMKKMVFSRTAQQIPGKNITVENGDLVSAVKSLKEQAGKDIIVYGGASFVSSLLAADLVDEMYLFVNPVALGNGLQIFKNRKPLRLARSIAYQNGMVVNKYVPIGNQ